MTVVKFSRTILIFLFTLLFIHYCFAQSYLLSSLPVEKELSSHQITSIFQDGKGFIWIGTEDGPNLYNANSIKIFKHDVKNKNSLLNNYIENICEDENGNNSPDENEIFGQYLRSPDIALLLLGKWSLRQDQYHSYLQCILRIKKIQML